MRADVALSGAEILRARAGPAHARRAEGLTDASITPKRGDHDADPVMKKISEVRPIRPPPCWCR